MTARSLGEPVYRARVRGTEDLELAYEIVQPDGTTDNFPVTPAALDWTLVRLGGDDRNDRDLRLVQGSALDRLLFRTKRLRSRMAGELAKSVCVREELSSAAQDGTFLTSTWPSGRRVHRLGSTSPSRAHKARPSRR